MSHFQLISFDDLTLFHQASNFRGLMLVHTITGLVECTVASTRSCITSLCQSVGVYHA